VSNRLQVDSLIANEFAVEINGEVIQGVFRVSGLVTFKLDEAGKRVKPPFSITKMVQRDPGLAINRWIRETAEARESSEHPRRHVTVIAIDDGVVSRRWTAKNAYIMSVAYSSFDSALSEMVEETITIAYDDIEESWGELSELE
jgi:hypothetical protein